VDYRTRRDRTERRTAMFKEQMEAITEAYMDWSLKYADRDDPVPDPPLPADSGVCSIRVVDLFSTSTHAASNFLTADVIDQLFMIQKPPSYRQINILHLLLSDRG
jgi:hypothetical protein